MTCGQARSMFSAYLDGVVTGKQMFSLAQHLHDCGLCAGEYDSLRETQRLVSKVGSAKNVPSESERIGSQADQQLSLDQKVAQVMGDEIGDCDRHQRQDKHATRCIGRHPLLGTVRDQCRDEAVDCDEKGTKGQESKSIDNRQS